MMHLKSSVAYAIGILIRVNQLESPVSASDIANGCQFPPRYLYRVLRRLVNAKLLASAPGPNGGYIFRKRFERITLLDIVLAVGDVSANRVEAVCQSQRPAIAKLNRLNRHLVDSYKGELARVSLFDLVEKPFSDLRKGSSAVD